MELCLLGIMLIGIGEILLLVNFICSVSEESLIEKINKNILSIKNNVLPKTTLLGKICIYVVLSILCICKIFAILINRIKKIICEILKKTFSFLFIKKTVS